MRHPVSTATLLTAMLGLAACSEPQAPPAPKVCCAPKPVNPASTTSPEPSQAPFVLPSRAPSPPASPIPVVVDPGAFDTAAPLPESSVSSDLAREEDGLVNAALASDELAGYLRTDLIHDGGVVLYRVQAAGEALPPKFESPRDKAASDRAADRPQGSTQAAPDDSGDDVDAETRKKPIARKVEKLGGRQITLRQACEPGEDCRAGKRRVKADVIVQQVTRAQVADKAGKPVLRSHAEIFRRTLVLRPEGGRMRLEAAGPFFLQAAGQLKGLDLQAVSVGASGATPLLDWRQGDKPQPVSAAPALVAGASLRVQVRIDQPDAAGLVVLAGFPGQTWAERSKLLPVGLEAPGGEFAGSITVPRQAGPTHVIVEVVDARSLLPTKSHRSLSLGFGARVVTTQP